jgi:hypothetical protein
MKTFFLSALILLSSCALAGKFESLELERQKITLRQSECRIELGVAQIPLEMDGDCHFIKRSGIIHTKYYKDINAHVVLIVGDPLPKDPNYPLTVSRSDCGSTIKALIVNETSIYLSDKSFSETVTCAGVGVDEKEYYMLSH